MTSSTRLDGDGEGLSEEVVERALAAIAEHADLPWGFTFVGHRATDPRAHAKNLAFARTALVAAGVPDLIGERDRLRAQVAAVEALHRPSTRLYTAPPEDGGSPLCDQCGDQPWPCPTILALSPSDEKDGDEG